MNYIWTIEIDIFCLVILSILMHSILKNYDKQVKQRYYVKALAVCMVCFASEMIWAIVEGFFLSFAAYISFYINAVYFLTSILTGYFWLCFVECSLEGEISQKLSIKHLAFMPVVFTLLGVVFSFNGGFFFRIDEQGKYVRGDYLLLHTCFCHLYTIITTCRAFVKSLTCKNYIKLLEYKILGLFLIFPLAIGIIQILIPVLPTVSVGMTFAFTFVYVDLQDLKISIDNLTGLNNRNQLYRYLISKMKSATQSKNLYVLMMDVNKFKKINDSFGHVEGDMALKRCATALRIVNKAKSNFVARYGGDEFIIVAEADEQIEIEDLCESIHDTLERICIEDKVLYPLSFSIGYAKYNENMKTIQEFIKEADDMLYEVKKNRIEA